MPAGPRIAGGVAVRTVAWVGDHGRIMIYFRVGLWRHKRALDRIRPSRSQGHDPIGAFSVPVASRPVGAKPASFVAIGSDHVTSH